MKKKTKRELSHEIYPLLLKLEDKIFEAAVKLEKVLRTKINNFYQKGVKEWKRLHSQN